MLLGKLLENIKLLNVEKPSFLEVLDIKSDSRLVEAGDLFVALKGTSGNDGNAFVDEALRRGAVAVVSSQPLEQATHATKMLVEGGGEANICHERGEVVDVTTGHGKAVYIQVEDDRAAYAKMADNFFGNPCRDLKFVGTTGTNGKTTVTHMIYHILNQCGLKCGLMGTLGHIVDGEYISSEFTTPDPYEMFKTLHQMKQNATKAVAAEVSAHAIFLKKLGSICAEAGVFTNLSQDHLDFFKTMEVYGGVKKSYFQPNFIKQAVVNIDDRVGVEITKETACPLTTYGLNNPADAFAVNVMTKVSGSNFFVNIRDDIAEVNLPLAGSFNVYNALAALATVNCLGVELYDAARALSTLQQIPGRFNMIDARKCHFVLDYAHSPDGLKKILSAARGITKGKLISVFGCGGNRDKVKRPIMGRISALSADITILTSDNPRFEEPEDIIKDIEEGIKGITHQYMNIIDREEAIKHAYKIANVGDVIVVAGKGAENYLDIKGVKIPYSDRQVIEKLY